MPEKRNGQHGNNPVESTKEAQDGTIGGVDDPDIGWRDRRAHSVGFQRYSVGVA